MYLWTAAVLLLVWLQAVAKGEEKSSTMLVRLKESDDGWHVEHLGAGEGEAGLTGSVGRVSGQRVLQVGVLTDVGNDTVLTLRDHRKEVGCDGSTAPLFDTLLVLPSTARAILVEEQLLPLSRTAVSLQDPDRGIERRPIQVTGFRHQQPNIVFVSAGYTAGDSERFFNDVDKAVAGLLLTEPWTKYLGLCNVFAVFQPSKEAGASRPDLRIEKDNNLKCSYGKTLTRALTCDRLSVQALAATAPAVDTTVVLVNDAEYGGTGGGQISHVYSGDRMVNVLLHELGHAMAGLNDEYSFNVKETEELNLPNCWSGKGHIPWQGWLVSGDVPQSPTQVCGYTNYFKPTPGTCLMESSANEDYCLVCRERVVLTLLGIKEKKVRLGSPRCPLEQEVTYVLPSADRRPRMAVNSRWARRDDVSIVWEVFEVRSGRNDIRVVGPTPDTGLGLYEVPDLKLNTEAVPMYKVVASLVDHTDWVLEENKPPGMFQDKEEFLLVVTDDLESTGCVSTKCSDSFGFDTTRCSVCLTEGNCTLDMVWRPYEPPNDLRKALMDRLTQIGLIGLAMVAGVVFLVCVCWGAVRRLCANEEGIDISPYTQGMKVMHAFVLGMSYLFLGSAILAFLYAIYLFQFRDNEMVGENFVVVTFILCISYVFYRLICQSCLVCKSRMLCIVAAVLILAEVGIDAMILLFLLMYLENLNGQQERMEHEMRQLWVEQTAENPALVCAAQRNLECSGWDVTCYNAPNPFQCPESCESSNLHAEPCSITIRSWFTDNSAALISCAAAATALWLLAAVACLVLACRIRRLSGASRAVEAWSPPKKENLEGT